MRSILDSIATRLDETRDIARYLIGLLVFLGLLGTFWGLLRTIGSIGATIQGLDPAGGDTASVLDALKAGLAAPLAGMGTAFSSSLFGLSGSLVLGFLDLQLGRAQNRFYTELENWLSSVTDVGSDMVLPPTGNVAAGGEEMRVLSEKLNRLVQEQGTSPRTSTAMANLAESIQGLVQHMRSEQQMLRDFVEAQASEQRELRQVLDRLAGSSASHAGTLADGAFPQPPQRTHDRLLAGLRRRPVDAAARDHVPAVGVRAGAVPPEPRDLRQGRGARPAEQPDQRADPASGAGALHQPGQRGPDRQSAGVAGRRRAAARALQQALESGTGSAAAACGPVEGLQTALDEQEKLSQRARTQVELLNQQLAALRQQIAALERALEVSENRDPQSQTKIADLGKRLNVALAQRVQELARYRSDFFGRLREILADRENIRVVGDRFVFQSEVLFPSGSAELQPAGRGDSPSSPKRSSHSMREIPSDINWIIRVDGHTDNVPISSDGSRTTGNCRPRAPGRWSAI